MASQGAPRSSVLGSSGAPLERWVSPRSGCTQSRHSGATRAVLVPRPVTAPASHRIAGMGMRSETR